MSDIFWGIGVTLDEVEKQVILKALRHFQGNKTRTAEALGIAVRTIDYKLERYKNEQDQGLQPSAGIHVESTTEDSSEQPMPVRKRRKV